MSGGLFRKYFARPKMRGHFDAKFFPLINEVFVCLVASAMRHALKSWKIGVYVEPTKHREIKYETSISMFTHAVPDA